MRKATRILLIITAVITGISFGLSFGLFLTDLLTDLLLVVLDTVSDILVIVFRNFLYNFLYNEIQADWLSNLDNAVDVINIIWIVGSALVVLIKMILTAVTTFAILAVDGVFFILTLIAVKKHKNAIAKKDTIFSGVINVIMAIKFYLEGQVYLIPAIIAGVASILVFVTPKKAFKVKEAPKQIIAKPNPALA